MRIARSDRWMPVCIAALLALVASAHAAQETKIVADFEDENDLKTWDFKQKSAAWSEQHVTHGKHSLKIAANEYMFWYKVPRDWSGFDSLEIDIFVEGNDPVGVSLLVGDAEWQKKSTYWNRHNGGYNLKPGANTISIPVNGLFRGEAGSRGNDLKTNIDPTQIVRMDLGFKGNAAALYLDHFRLVRETRPAGILAFDFGPPSQAVFPGFTPISFNTVYGQNGNTAGLKHAGWGSSLARDDTFPTRLYQDFVEMGTDPDCKEFVADIPANGLYHCWVMFDDCGYWGGEEARHHRRSIESNGKEVWVDDRGADGAADYLFRFEKIEPKPGDNLWDLYMKDLFVPRRFDVNVTDGKLSLVFKADKPWSSKVAAIIVYPDSQKADAEKWVKEIEDRNRREFEARATFMGPKPKDLKVPADAAAKGYWLGFPSLEENITFVDEPGKSDAKLSRTAALGQFLSFTFAARPLKDFTGPVELKVSDLKSADGNITAANVDVRYVHHALKRGFNDIAYQIEPESLRHLSGSDLILAKDMTRQFWLTVHVPDDAKAGTYTGEAVLTAGELNVKVPFTVEVIGVKLDEPDFTMGFYGAGVPGELPDERKKTALKELFTLLKDSGMNSFTGGPDIQFKGLAADGKPELDFTAVDAYFKVVKECGFRAEVQSYGGPAMVSGLHDGYVIGETGHNWEKKTGKSFHDLLKIVWTAVKEHGEKEGWPPMAYGFTDEPRTIESAQAQVELMKAYRDAVPFVKIGGSYSVPWGNEPIDKAIQEIFKTLVWSGLNLHTQVDLDKAKEFGRQIYIYNQGTSRFSFGAYQWAELRKGVHGRMQWHLLALHGYQFFDLDGREPDSAMINWGRSEIIPTIHLHRCREGATDFRCAVTLWNLAEKKKGTPEAKAAQEWLEDVNAKIAVAQRQRPQGFIDDETFRNTCFEHIRKLLK